MESSNIPTVLIATLEQNGCQLYWTKGNIDNNKFRWYYYEGVIYECSREHYTLPWNIIKINLIKES